MSEQVASGAPLKAFDGFGRPVMIAETVKSPLEVNELGTSPKSAISIVDSAGFVFLIPAGGRVMIGEFPEGETEQLLESGSTGACAKLFIGNDCLCPACVHMGRIQAVPDPQSPHPQRPVQSPVAGAGKRLNKTPAVGS